jgi:hypothetical protein
MQFRSKLLKRRAAAAGATLKKIYDVYMTPYGHFATGEQEDAVGDTKPRNGVDRNPSTSFAQKFDYLHNK